MWLENQENLCLSTQWFICCGSLLKLVRASAVSCVRHDHHWLNINSFCKSFSTSLTTVKTWMPLDATSGGLQVFADCCLRVKRLLVCRSGVTMTINPKQTHSIAEEGLNYWNKHDAELKIQVAEILFSPFPENIPRKCWFSGVLFVSFIF